MSKEKHKKTNALRILDTHKIPYRACRWPSCSRSIKTR